MRLQKQPNEPTRRPNWVRALLVGAAFGIAVASASQAGAQTVEPNNAAVATPRPTGSLAGLVAAQHLFGTDAEISPQTSCTGLLGDTTLIGQVLMPGVPWDQTSSIIGLLADGLIGGWVVMGVPDDSLANRLAEARGASDIAPLIAVDEEGGRVQRLRQILNRLPSAQTQAANNTPDELRLLIAEHARDMVELGFDVDLAPVVDVGGGPGIGDRAYSDDVDEVIEYAEAVRLGLADGGLLGVVKHFPGHGRASADSHLELPTSPSIEEIRAVDLQPFRVAINNGADAVMVAHIAVPGLTNGAPASLSPAAVTGLLREELGFDGLIFTDSLDMGAIVDQWTTPQAVELALIAGNDIMLLGNASEIADIHAHLQASMVSGQLDRALLVDAASRVLTAKAVFSCSRVELN